MQDLVSGVFEVSRLIRKFHVLESFPFCFIARSSSSRFHSYKCRRLFDAMYAITEVVTCVTHLLDLGSNDTIQSTKHRVQAPPSIKTDITPDRYSIPYVRTNFSRFRERIFWS